jgi:hypothetical protein
MQRVAKTIVSLILLTTAMNTVIAQVRDHHSTVALEMSELTPMNFGWRRFLPGLKPDPDRTFKSTMPYLALPVATTALLGDLYWMGSTTRQSYNAGKIGRTYYWDQQGNLRGSTLFIDIAGKGKRGLKLAFARHRALF